MRLWLPKHLKIVKNRDFPCNVFNFFLNRFFWRLEIVFEWFWKVHFCNLSFARQDYDTPRHPSLRRGFSKIVKYALAPPHQDRILVNIYIFSKILHLAKYAMPVFQQQKKRHARHPKIYSRYLGCAAPAEKPKNGIDNCVPQFLIDFWVPGVSLFLLLKNRHGIFS